MDALDFRLLNDWQHDFPLVSAPFRSIAAELGVGEAEVLDAAARLAAAGRISRIGAVFAPRRVGASTLAALRVPAARLAEVAARVSAFPGVNHNYEREHDYNLWFVVTAASTGQLAATLAAIEAACGLPVLKLPLEAEYHIDLGFALDRLHGTVATATGHHRTISPFEKGGTRGISAAVEAAGAGQSPPVPRLQRRVETNSPPAPVLRLDAADQALVAALQDGLPLCSRPYASVARRLGVAEDAVLARIADWLSGGVLKRFGVVVRHRELGYTANAMLVHDIPDALVDELGRRLGDEAAVTLCYRRPRVLPAWRYNLFCMIHGQQRAAVEAQITDLRRRHHLANYPHAILFSRTRFKQQGARYAETRTECVGA